MNSAIQQLVQSFLQKDDLQQYSVQELQQLAAKYPYSAATHLLVAQKIKAEHQGSLPTEQPANDIYFHNPFWLDQLLNEKGTVSIKTKEKELLAAPEPIIEVIKEEATIEIPAAIPVTEAVETATSYPAPETATLVEEVVMNTELKTEESPAVVGEMEQQVIAISDEPAIKIPAFKIEPVDPANATLTFEPYHTVDYFASQGIKFSTDEKPKDKFGQQLKSFTEWLKTIKKIPATELGNVATNQQAEQKVEQLAEKSLTEGDVLTEAMAEVWAKQGNTAKAIITYQKLSLLNPSKSSYFAGLIEQLKQS
jgi:hypothetical protein